MLQSLRRTLLLALTLLSFVPCASATWSIVVVNRRTGEVAIGAATCIPRVDLTRGLAAIVVGKGGAVMQALSGGEDNLVLISDGLRLDEDPAVLLALAEQADPFFKTRQVGIVGMSSHAPVTFTGTNVGRFKWGVAGEAGDLAYAIQGNVLTGRPVIDEAERALLSTPGDLSQKLMAAMRAARDYGGDGRCSCSLAKPASCGSPPADFEKSADVGFMLLARIGDPDSPCLSGFGCASAEYTMRLVIKGKNGQPSSPDPVDQLEDRYADWRAQRAGRPDGLLSRTSSVQSMPADGRTRRSVTVSLVDIDGVPLTSGGATLSISADGGPALADIGPVLDHGDGTYSFELTAGTTPGTDRFVIVADDGVQEATLFPYLEVRQDAVEPLHAGYDEVSARAGATIPLSVHEPAAPNAPYLLLGSVSGTSPGIQLGDVFLPLHLDDFLHLTVHFAGDSAIFPGTRGLLDDAGHAEAGVIAKRGILRPLIGRSMHWAGVVLRDGKLTVTNPVTIEVLP